MRNTVINSLLLVGFLGGCSLTPVEQPPVVESCPPMPEQPVVEVAECPVCPELQCPAPQVIEKIITKTVEVPVKVSGGELDLPIIGAVESIRFEMAGLNPQGKTPAFIYPARIDTGAESTSLHAENIHVVERDGKRWVRFTLVDPKSGEPVQHELRFKRRVLIKQNEAESERRYVVRMWVSLGDIRTRIDVNLTDRDDYEYPALIGRNFLTDSAIVDVSRQNLIEP